MNSKQMRVFLQVIEKGNLSEVAKDLDISQPAVTGTIKKLEEDFETPLFVRKGKSLMPNAQGQLLYQMYKEILFTENLSEICRGLHNHIKKIITIGIQSYNDYFLSLTDEFVKQNPDYCFIIKSDSFFVGSNIFSSADFVLSYDYEVKNSNKLTIDIQNRLYAVLPVNHPLASLPQVSLSSLKEEFFIFSKGAKGDGYEPCYYECINAGFIPNVSLVVDIPAAKFSAASAGCGIGLTYNTKQKMSALAYNCVSVECKEIKNIQTICLSWKDNLSEVAEFFLNWIIKYQKNEL